MKRWLMLSMLMLGFGTQNAVAANSKRWMVYYGKDLNASTFNSYELMVLDPAYYTPARQMPDSNKMILAYISVSEAGNHQQDYSLIEKNGWLLDVPANWPGNRMIDVRNSGWNAYILEEIIPQILAKGFKGIMLDTIDSAVALEASNPMYGGMSDATINLVRSIRAHYPSITIMVNRGFEVIPRFVRHIDYVLAESILINAKPDKASYKPFADDVYISRAKELKRLSDFNPKLSILTLDYWPKEDAKGIAQIYASQRAQGFSPYVGPFSLNEIWEEPK